MKVQILGTGCSSCRVLEEHARLAIAELGNGAEVEKVTDLAAIVNMGVMSTPALAVDGVVKSVGRILTKDQILALLR